MKILFWGRKNGIIIYDIDKEYVKYLQKEEMNERGFTKVPNIEYPGNLPKFTCGVVLDVHEYKYYVPVSSYKMQNRIIY